MRIAGKKVDAEKATEFGRQVDAVADAGARVLYDPGRQGAVLPPVVVDQVPSESELVMEETFGPVLPVLRLPNDDRETMQISNSTQFGLSSGVCTNRIDRMTACVNGYNIGTVHIWKAPAYRLASFPFGGIKDSDLGDMGDMEGVSEAMKGFTND